MRSILGKLWLGITALVIIIIMLMWFFQVFLLNTFYFNGITNTLERTGNKIASLLEQDEGIRTISEEIKNEIEALETSSGVFIVIIPADLGEIYTSLSGAAMFRRQDFIKDPNILRKIQNGEPFAVRKDFNQAKGTYITVGTPLSYNGTVIGSVILMSPVQRIRENITVLRSQLTIITLISLSIGTILSLFLAKIFTKPIIKIIHAAKKITKGDYGTKVYISSQDEIGVLGDTINNLSTQLGQTEKFRREFIANTTHEFKTPISLIKAYAELVMEWDEEQKENINKHLNIIIEESDRLNTMVEDMLYLSKMEAGYYKPKMDSFNIVEVAEKVIKKLTCIADENNTKIILDTSSDKINVTGDENEIQHVLLNLVNNAIIHSSTGDNITVKVTDLATKVRVEIIDNGVGIPSEDLPYIWDRFYKVDKSRQRKNSGTGLGMSIVKNILEAHGFEYGIKSVLGKGTTVWFETRDE